MGGAARSLHDDLTAGTGKEPEGLYVASHLLGGPTGKRGDWLTDTPPSDLDTLTDGGNTSSDGGDAPSAVPLPPALLLFGSGLAALGLRSRWRLAKENSQSA